MLTKEEQVKNIVAFLCVLLGEKCGESILKVSPDYLIEKFNRYCLSTRDEYDWGMHPLVRKNVFNQYCEKFGLTITSDDDE